MRRVQHAGAVVTHFASQSCQGSPFDRSQDKIHMEGLTFHGYHGVLPEETRLGQKFVVDATLHCDLQAAGVSDDLDQTVDYSKVYSQIQRIVEGRPYKLIESLAENIAAKVLASQPRVTSIHVHVRKPHVAVTGVLQSLGVSIWRARPTG
ncbi:hypothetical protein WJX72_007580 [[Myrmecia] bisecta]|uniref:7,8-dihydroneopterin aldolase n=1 Tax=[Myrmecia] bisecta TaxID=41462 RepID=A0AAW1Q538_9CHLO